LSRVSRWETRLGAATWIRVEKKCRSTSSSTSIVLQSRTKALQSQAIRFSRSQVWAPACAPRFCWKPLQRPLERPRTGKNEADLRSKEGEAAPSDAGRGHGQAEQQRGRVSASPLDQRRPPLPCTQCGEHSLPLSSGWTKRSASWMNSWPSTRRRSRSAGRGPHRRLPSAGR
jgi:hypothetical protein